VLPILNELFMNLKNEEYLDMIPHGDSPVREMDDSFFVNI